MKTAQRIEGLTTSDRFVHALAWIFAAAFLWPFLHLLAKTYDGIETLMLPALIQIPTFLLVHVIGLVKMHSDSPSSEKLAKRSIGIVWYSIIGFWVLVLIAAGVSTIFEKK